MTHSPHTAPDRLRGQHAVVVGATGGLGRATCTVLARAGAAVHLIGRRLDELNQLAEQLAVFDVPVTVHATDVADPSHLAASFQSVPQLDVMVNAVGTNSPQPVLDVTPDEVDALLHTNVKIAFFALQAAARRLIADQRPGSLITISSQLGHVGFAGRSVYAATKHAVEGIFWTMTRVRAGAAPSTHG